MGSSLMTFLGELQPKDPITLKKMKFCYLANSLDQLSMNSVSPDVLLVLTMAVLKLEIRLGEFQVRASEDVNSLFTKYNGMKASNGMQPTDFLIGGTSIR
jgi:hypothetical protein